jgi:flagellar biosynthetic protein FliP
MTEKRGRRVRVTTVAASLAALIVSATPLAAQDISINLGQGAATGGLNERIIQLVALLTVLSLAPSILVMMTSFTRIVVVLSLLRTALRHGDLAAEFSGHIAGIVSHRLRDGAGADPGL